MNNWPLSIKLTAWSALVVGLGVLACAIATILYLKHEQMESLDDELERSAKHFLQAWAASQDETERRALLDAFVSDGSTRRMVELESAAGAVVVCSSGLQPAELARLRKKCNTLTHPDGRYRIVQVEKGSYRVRLAARRESIVIARNPKWKTAGNTFG